MKRRQSGMAMVVVLSMVVVLGAIVAFAIIVSGTERRNTGKLIHNMSLQTMTEATLQFGRNYFANNYGVRGSKWDMYLSYFVNTPMLLDTPANITATLNHLQNDTFSDGTTRVNVLINPNTPSGTTCYTHVRDNVDELPPLVNNPSHDNDLLIYVGALCIQLAGGNTESKPLIAELVAPLLFNANSALYVNQASGGTQGLNNSTVAPGFR